jgi:ADP-ribose pyrophosphatase YjhB (NUDIX family)
MLEAPVRADRHRQDGTVRRVAIAAGILARGPWDPSQVTARWRSEEYEPEQSATNAADELLADLRDRGSPSHDGLAARLAGYDAGDDALALELQPARWALRLLPAGAAQSMSIVCIVRSADGSWLAGRRAEWLASWPGRWALGAAGSVEVGEQPTDTIERELLEEWSVDAERLRIEALLMRPSELVMLVAQAWLGDGTEVRPDSEHDEFAWWPADVDRWPAEGHESLRRIASLLS